jgi:hemerythrin-like domain-containing protein
MPTGSRTKPENAIAMLRNDHQKVKELFDKFEESKNSASQAKIAADAVQELKVHATVEEELFYPAVRQQIDDEDGIMPEADEEHHVAKVLIAELENMTGDEEHWEAKFMVLAESVRHHIKEEEREMFPKARKTDIDFVALGAQMSELKKRLIRDGVPPDAEAKMISTCGLRGDSPALKAQATVQVPLKSKRSDAA